LSLLCVVDHNPLPLLCSALALARQHERVAVHLLHRGRRTESLERLAALLRKRGLTVELDASLGQASSAEDLARCVASACGRLGPAVQPDGWRALDVSSASGDLAIHALAAARSTWGDAFRLTAFRSESGGLAIERGATPPMTEARLAVDIGAGAGAVTPAELLSLFGFRRTRQHPYGAGSTASAAAEKTLDAAALALLEIFQANPGDEGPVAGFRRLLQRELARAGDRRPSRGEARIAGGWISLPRAEVPARVLEVARSLELSGLVRVTKDALRVSETAGGGGGVFFLAGGWLEISAAAALRRAFPDRQVDLNLGVDWGDDATEAEMDVAFVAHNRLYLVSCKNEWNEDRLRSHLDRLRAMVAEFGETWVRPMLFSTKELPARLAKRARDYECGLLQGPSLLNELRAAIKSQQGAAALAARLRARAPVRPRAGR